MSFPYAAIYARMRPNTVYAAQHPAGQWNLSADGGTLMLSTSGHLKNTNVLFSNTLIQSVDLAWSCAAGTV